MSPSTPPSPTTSLQPTTIIPSILSILISEKLTKTIYQLWRAQVLPTVRATELDGLLTRAETA
jgi:hypothetical protein